MPQWVSGSEKKIIINKKDNYSAYILVKFYLNLENNLLNSIQIQHILVHSIQIQHILVNYT